MSDDAMRLPADLLEWLDSGRDLKFDPGECECGQVALTKRQELVAEVIEVLPREPDHSLEDPHGEDDGAYQTHAVNLVSDAENYSPEFILCWLPELKAYGSYDVDHGVLRVFMGATWTQIAANPLPYLNAQWRSDEPDCPGADIKPWEFFEFVRAQEE